MKRLGKTILDRLLRRPTEQLVHHGELIRLLAESNFRLRVALKLSQKQPIHLLLVCHLPALWSTLESVYHAAEADSGMRVTVVTLPYRHGSLRQGEFKDGGMMEFLRDRGVPAVQGYDPVTKHWRSPASFDPDYVIFQTPYTLFPSAWSVASIAVTARLGYIPYGVVLLGGDVAQTTHPPEFFEFMDLIFAESEYARDAMAARFSDQGWFSESKIVVTGFPKLDFATQLKVPAGGAWRRGFNANNKRILWTPRWRTSEGNCHFFDYKDYFVELCEHYPELDFVFRPHPLCLQNFQKTGEMTDDQQKNMERIYQNSVNMAIDRGGDYQDTLLTTDILVSDVCSLMFEFLATGKPIVYTHRVDAFNEIGRKLADAFYWVGNRTELDETLAMLIRGEDPMRPKRIELMESLLFLPPGGAGLRIKDSLKRDFSKAIASYHGVTEGFGLVGDDPN